MNDIYQVVTSLPHRLTHPIAQSTTLLRIIIIFGLAIQHLTFDCNSLLIAHLKLINSVAIHDYCANFLQFSLNESLSYFVNQIRIFCLATTKANSSRQPLKIRGKDSTHNQLSCCLTSFFFPQQHTTEIRVKY